MPVSLPLSSGITLPTALAAPVLDGMMLPDAARPSRHCLPDGPSATFWVAVMAWTVVISPSTMPKLSCTTLASGARQLVVQEAFETNCILRRIGLVVHAHHEHRRVVLRRRRHDDALGARGQMALGLLLGQKHAGGFDDVVGADFDPKGFRRGLFFA